MVRTLRRAFAGHPLRAAAALVAVVAAGWLFWYLASPLWTRTEAREELAGTATTLARGELAYVDPIHNGKGQVLVVQTGAQRLVRFEDVAITNAPDVHVYLSKDSGGRYVAANALYLGALKATDGSFHYEIPATADVADYRSVVVWCRRFAVLITWADLAR